LEKEDPAEDLRDLKEKATSHNATDGEMLRFLVAEIARMQHSGGSLTSTAI
jgi:hypothetical protein